MTDFNSVTIFGEVLFDCFPNGEKVLGGAPFNICWHLQAFGDSPVFVSRIGQDALGVQILKNARDWGIETQFIQQDPQHPTGQVQIELIDNEPHYDITAHSAYDFIRFDEMNLNHHGGILYHGSLALRSADSKQQFVRLQKAGDWSVFLDVNLRAPWWDKTSLFKWLHAARWVKLNIDELHELGFNDSDLQKAMHAFRSKFACQQLIVTQGAEGSSVLCEEGFFRQTPPKIEHFVDTVGAGDAFTSVYIHGLLHNWPIQHTLQQAQTFAAKIIGLRGALSTDPDFYRNAFRQ
ncbi:PfkB family carbohydrate kinase [Thiomicrorhabdus sp. 6S3-12]|uniref:PfkB family carbohydrate kinase n=1 Tax=Thiomicrorhabdus sp. 6S3-12 TaxID=2819681 RepID=UPI001AACB9B3|nr:PfkB family carbohydrate kinase [Thiomicrorhabdus sp. 6S3-12]MBO1924592.1 carbohydrate kinase [Thiomicrorhabdus sp. 6S3-12]